MSAGGAAGARSMIELATPERDFQVHKGAVIEGDALSFAQKGYRQRLVRSIQNAQKSIRARRFVVCMLVAVQVIYVVVVVGVLAMNAARGHSDGTWIIEIYTLIVLSPVLVVCLIAHAYFWRSMRRLRRTIVLNQSLFDGENPATYVAAPPKNKKSYLKIIQAYSNSRRKLLSILVTLPSFSIVAAISYETGAWHNPVFMLFSFFIIIPALFLSSQIWPSVGYISQRGVEQELEELDAQSGE